MSSTPSVDPQALALVEQSLMRECASQLEAARVAQATRPFDPVKHAEVFSAVTAAFDAHKTAFLALMTKVGRMSNGLAPVNHLPSDVLLEILLYLPLEGRLKASRVCSYWRSTAVNAARLWADLNLSVRADKTEKLFALLERTKGAEVDLELRFLGAADKLKCREITRQLEPYFCRLRTFSWWAHCAVAHPEQFVLSWTDTGEEYKSLPIVIYDAPLLRRAALKSSDGPWRGPACSFHLSMKPGAFAALEVLRVGPVVDDTFKKWPELPALIHLHIHWSATLPGSTLYAVLRGSPALIALIIEGLDEFTLSDPSAEASPMLPKLDVLALSGAMDESTLRRVFDDLAPSTIDEIQLMSKYASAHMFSWTTSWNFGVPCELHGIVTLSLVDEPATDPWTGNLDYTLFTIHVGDGDERHRVFYDVVEPALFVDTIAGSLRELSVDCDFWFTLSPDVEFPAVVSLSILGLISSVSQARRPTPLIGAAMPALRTVSIFVGTRECGQFHSEKWTSLDIAKFMDLQIKGYSIPLEKLFICGGRLAKGSNRKQTYARLAPYAKRLVIDQKNIDSDRFDELLDWIPEGYWD
ncbi:hypothetical protein EXIGLDRAFT_833091 [Exidia glandulosa HHB12029]|uniref:F-box domain-containing protein n=1 Tax=Exidia glandulosa HHB12029 TaxID=1314781 RepID=A0A165KYJ7_EXIGL|nr:hypothetical protein EXIGLDRAFT_833091 [Exidia glandulosa HHB12029]